MSSNSMTKKTAIGIVPSEWEIISYEEAFNFLSTASYSRDALSLNGQIYYVHYGDIHTKFNQFIDFKKSSLPTISEIQKNNYSLLKNGDIIIVDASEDYSALCKTVEIKNLGDKKAISGLHTFLLRDKNNNFIDGFKGYINSNPYIKDQFDRLATGLKVYGLSKKNLKSVIIPRPPLHEQKVIAEVLSDTDELIQSLEKQIEKKRLIKQGVMQKLLTPKDDWESRLLDDIAINLDHLRVPLNDFQRAQMKGDIPYCGANGILDYVDDYVVNDDVILIAEDGGHFYEYQTRPIAYRMSGKCWVNNHAHILKAKDSTDQNFLFYSLVHKNIIDFIVGGTRAKLNKNNLMNIPIHIPKRKSEQTEIAAIIDDIYREVKILEDKYHKYSLIKIGLMQNLLTGKIRLV